jgi:hypothetical protein
VIIHAYNDHVRLLSPEPLVVNNHSLLGAKEPTLLCNHSPYQDSIRPATAFTSQCDDARPPGYMGVPSAPDVPDF